VAAGDPGAALVLRRHPGVAQLAVDNQISLSTAYRYLHEGIDVLAAVAPGLHGALLAARAAGHTHVQLDGTLVRTDRSTTAGPTVRGGRVVVGQAPSPRREHPGDHRPGRLAAVGLRRTPRPRA
jgi:hypothetical protein